MPQLKKRFTLLHLVMITIILIIFKITFSATYNFISVNHTAKQKAALAVIVMNHARLALEANYNKPLLPTHIITRVSKLESNYHLFDLVKTSHKPKDAIELNPKVRILPDDVFLKLVNQLYHDGSLSIAVKINPTTWVVMTASSNHQSQWLIPSVFLLIGAMIIIFIWMVFFNYYNHSLPHELLRFITEEKRHNKKRSSKLIDNVSAQVKQFYDEKNIMLTGLSHDIRTPLTEAMLKLEMLDDKSVGESIMQNLNDINTIIKTSLEYSKDHSDIKLEDHDVLKIINTIAQGYDGFSFHIDVSADSGQILWPIEPALFRRLMINLINNAKKYADEAEIDITHDEKQLTMTFCDNGPGVPKDALAKLGTPYFRVDQSRSKQTGGTGLGLAIARKICQLHNGSIAFSNGKKGGLAILISFKV